MSAFDIPCRVSADLRRFMDHEPRQEFDEHDDTIMRAILPAELVKPVMQLLKLRREIDDAERIDALNRERALAWARADLDELYSACKARFYDL